MKRLMFLAVMLISLAVIMPSHALAGKKRDARVAYVLKNLSVRLLGNHLP